MWEKQSLQEGLQEPDQESAPGNSKESHWVENATLDRQQDRGISDQEFDGADQEFDVVRTKTFNFHYMRSVLITKVRTDTSQNIAEVDYKIYTAAMAA